MKGDDVMAVRKPKKIKNMALENIRKRIAQMLHIRAKYINNGIENIHVKLQPGNTKT